MTRYFVLGALVQMAGGLVVGAGAQQCSNSMYAGVALLILGTIIMCKAFK